ncbi:hypothetical protein HYH02_004795 [Chlamydomonas schloesseri]|uniref:EF-hand domain-containing protein n=1 Tax=Chlamydomonas schloesseri TaxID=2026947 RepID=A0A835WMV8_9CHLO|nr:hypothetical protein HYH02_004795 [Chlamydomonas schloesseri]|eukprot:KAG2450287.1 hypothetical protein HYH02_004795 [Chlamydomonas schloesseri]
MFNVGQDGRKPAGGMLPRMSLTDSGGAGGHHGAPGGGRAQRHSVAQGAGGGGGGVLGHGGGGARPSYMPKYSGEQQGGTDAVNQDILRRVKAKFDSADMDGSGQLQPQEFINAFLGILQTEDGGDAEALAKLFMRIDANSDGTVDWDEFSTYMLLESQGSARVREFESTVTMQQPDMSMLSEHTGHRDAMTHITSMRLANGVDRYATCGRDGTVRLWNAKDLKHVKTITLPPSRPSGPDRDAGGSSGERLMSATRRQPKGHGGLWATCSAFMPLTQKLAIGSFSRSIRIYDLASYELSGQIPQIDYVPLSLDVWVPPRAKDTELLVVGDGGGWVRLFEVRFNTPGTEAAAAAVSSGATASGGAGGGGPDKGAGGGGGSGLERMTERSKWRYHHHNDWVMCVKYVSDMNCVLAASLDKTVSITDAEERVPLKKLEGHHTKGVNSVDWSSLYKFVVTGSLDRRVIMWNPFSQKPLAVLSGHNAAVTGVVVNDRDNQIISLSTDHVVKIWDIRNHKCIQSLPDRELLNMPQMTEDAVTPALYDSERRQLVTGYTRPKVWKMTSAGAGATQAHSASVTRVMYNANFAEAISADHAGTISVWHVPTGKLRYRFLRCHGDKRITALAFDAAKRRLISGAEDGDCKIWNFSSGACLSHLQSRARAEVTALVPLRGPLTRYVLAAGWDRRITFFEDNAAKTVGPSRALAGHKADILAMVALEGSSTVVTASDDGEVWVWNMDSCAPKRRMVAPGTAARPANERAVEALAFLSASAAAGVAGGGGPGGAAAAAGGGGGNSRLRSVLVAVGADRWLRLWDVLDGALLAERFTGHRQGETVQALALDGNNRRIATGDSGGMIKVWDMSRYPGGSLSHAAAAATIREAALWRGHKSHVTSLDWVDPGAGAGIGGGRLGGRLFLASSSADCTISLWSEEGVRVGTFGQTTWSLMDPGSWAAREVEQLDERDSWIMEASRTIPRTDPSAPLTGNGTYSAGSPSPEPPSDAQTYGTPAGTFGGAAASSAASASGGGAAGSRSFGRPGSVLGAAATATAAAGAATRSGGASARGPLSPRVGGAAGGGVTAGGAAPRQRPDSATSEIALVCDASNALRAQTRSSVRRLMSMSRGGGLSISRKGSGSDLPLAGDDGSGGGGDGGGLRPSTAALAGAPDRPMSGVRRPGALTAGGADGLHGEYLSGEGEEEEGEEEEEEEEQLSSSETSGDHASDTEVPVALWLADFNAARQNKLFGAGAAAVGAAGGGGGSGGGGGREGGGGGPSKYNTSNWVSGYRNLKISEMSALQERPATSYMASRHGVATAAGVLTRSPDGGSPTRRPGTSASASPGAGGRLRK